MASRKALGAEYDEAWYKRMKDGGHSDQAIADSLFIHINTFSRWKRQLGISDLRYTMSNRHKRSRQQ